MSSRYPRAGADVVITERNAGGHNREHLTFYVDPEFGRLFMFVNGKKVLDGTFEVQCVIDALQEAAHGA